MPTVYEMLGRAEGLTKTQRRIFDYMMSHPEAVCYATLKDLSERIGVSEVSVLNMCRSLGCSGYAEMKKEFRLYIAQRLRNTFTADYKLETDNIRSDSASAVRSLFDAERKNLSALAENADRDAIISCAQTLMQAREVLLYGHDVSKILADYFAHRLNYLRIKASSFKLGDSSTVQTSLAMANERDAVVLFSFPPYYKPVSNVARYAAYRGAKVVAITDSLQSPAVTDSSCNFICDTKTKFFFNTLTGPFSLINVITSYIAMEMGPALRAILEEELSASRFMNGEFEEEEGENKN